MMLLAPEHRTLYTEALTPPPGMEFKSALATTYSLDLTTLLTVPAHFALASTDDGDELLADPVLLLEALQRCSKDLVVFCQEARVGIPSPPNCITSLLEECVVEVKAPRDGGNFHPKIWVLHFAGDDAELVRLLVLSRNITADRCWDISVLLEGHPTGQDHVVSAPLAELIAVLPSLSPKGCSQRIIDLTRDLAALVRRTEWELPSGFDRLEFIVFGTDKKTWRPPPSTKLLVISPFCHAGTLAELASTTSDPVAVIARPEELQQLGATPTGFRSHFVLRDDATTDDGEDTSASVPTGLHAKCYILETGSDTRYYLGSANATRPGLGGRNVEVLLMLQGKHSSVGTIDHLLGKDGFQPLLALFQPVEAPPEDPLERAAEEAVELARAILAGELLHVRCVPGDGGWGLVLEARCPLSLSPDVTVKAWPITMPEASAVKVSSLVDKIALASGAMALESLTGFVAFDVTAKAYPTKVRFTLNLPVLASPAGRLAAIMRQQIKNERGFIRYLQLLLGDEATPVGGQTQSARNRRGDRSRESNGATIVPALLEPLVRALSRHPERLERARHRIRELLPCEDIVPRDFIPLWETFERVLEGER